MSCVQQHFYFDLTVYVDTGVGQSNPIIVTVITSGPAMSRHWRIRITQIPCTSIAKADQGCLQYHSGVYGRVRSFNFGTSSGRQLSNQEYSVCVRTERNFCSIQYRSCPDPCRQHCHITDYIKLSKAVVQLQSTIARNRSPYQEMRPQRSVPLSAEPPRVVSTPAPPIGC